MAKLYFEDFVAGHVAEYGDKLVTTEEIKEFASEFDPQPMHLDEEGSQEDHGRWAVRVGMAHLLHDDAHRSRRLSAQLIFHGRAGRRGNPLARAGAAGRPAARAKASILETARTEEPAGLRLRAKTQFSRCSTRSGEGVVMHSTTNMMMGRRTPRATQA